MLIHADRNLLFRHECGIMRRNTGAGSANQPGGKNKCRSEAEIRSLSKFIPARRGFIGGPNLGMSSRASGCGAKRSGPKSRDPLNHHRRRRFLTSCPRPNRPKCAKRTQLPVPPPSCHAGRRSAPIYRGTQLQKHTERRRAAKQCPLYLQ